MEICTDMPRTEIECLDNPSHDDMDLEFRNPIEKFQYSTSELYPVVSTSSYQSESRSHSSPTHSSRSHSSRSHSYPVGSPPKINKIRPITRNLSDVPPMILNELRYFEYSFGNYTQMFDRYKNEKMNLQK